MTTMEGFDSSPVTDQLTQPTYQCSKGNKLWIGTPPFFYARGKHPVCPDCYAIQGRRRKAAGLIYSILQIKRKVSKLFTDHSRRWLLDLFFDQNCFPTRELPPTSEKIQEIIFEEITKLDEGKLKQELFSNWIRFEPSPLVVKRKFNGFDQKKRVEEPKRLWNQPELTHKPTNSWENHSWVGTCSVCGKTTELNKGRANRCLKCRRIFDLLSEVVRRTPKENHPKIINALIKKVEELTGTKLEEKRPLNAEVRFDKGPAPITYYEKTSIRKAVEQSVNSEMGKIIDQIRTLTNQTESCREQIKKLFVITRNTQNHLESWGANFKKII